MAPISTIIVRIIAFILFCLVLPVYQEAVNCYVCHYSPKDRNRTEEYCTTANFRSKANQIYECEKGCEQVSSWDNNGVLEHFHRNCYRDDTATPGKCEKTPKKSFTREVCVCLTNLCNDALSIRVYHWTCILLTTAMILPSWLG